jgi:cell division protein FtsB
MKGDEGDVVNSELKPADDTSIQDLLKDDEEGDDTETLIKNNFSKKKEDFGEKKRIVQFIIIGVFIAIVSILIQFFMAYQFSKANYSSSHLTFLTEKVKELSHNSIQQRAQIEQLQMDKLMLMSKIEDNRVKLSKSLSIHVRGKFFIFHIFFSESSSKEIRVKPSLFSKYLQ